MLFILPSGNQTWQVKIPEMEAWSWENQRTKWLISQQTMFEYWRVLPIISMSESIIENVDNWHWNKFMGFYRYICIWMVYVFSAQALLVHWLNIEERDYIE